MATFLTPLRIEKVGPQRWRLLESFVFKSDKYPGIFVAPPGFETNFASIPRVFWTIFPPVDIYDGPAVIHDAAYGHALLTEDGRRMNVVKPIADRLFYEALRVCGVNVVKARIMYGIVALVGSPTAALEIRAAAGLHRGPTSGGMV